MSRRGSTSLAGALLALVAPAVLAGTVPLSADIVVDGRFADWTEVLTNPLNTSRDAEGLPGTCPSSADRDCPVLERRLDLARFSWTWNETHFFFLLRTQDRPDGDRAFVYLDLDRNGLMTTGELVLVADFAAGSGAPLGFTSYVQDDPVGDPLADPAGFADGHGMPGTLTSLPAILEGSLGLGPDDRDFEGAVPWSVLGVPAGSAMGFHVCSAAGMPPLQTRDNMGGANGGPGDTGFSALEWDGPSDLSAAPGATVRLEHELFNLGNVSGVVLLQTLSATGQDVHVYLDLDRDMVAETWVATDAGGDGAWGGAGDVLSPFGDSDLDGRLDVGQLGPFDRIAVALEQSFSLMDDGVRETLSLTARHAETGAVALAEDTVRIGAIGLHPDGKRVGVAGDAVWFPHVLQNNTGLPQTIQLWATSTEGWPYDSFEDVDDDGDPADAVLITDTDATGEPDLRVPSGQSRSLLVRTDVPPGAPVGQVERATVRARLVFASVAMATDTTTVSVPVDLSPDYLRDDGDARFGGAGTAVYFAHRLVNAQSAGDSFDLSAVSDTGWVVQFLSDPDGDGRPHDAEALPGRTAVVDGNGGENRFLVRVLVPEDAMVDEAARVEITATSRTNPLVTATVTDDVVVAIVRTYVDPLHVTNANRFPPCVEIHANATGLAPRRQGFRFSWRDGSGTPVRSADAITDSHGECSDRLDLFAGDYGPDWTVEILHDDGTGEQVLDTAAFAIGHDLAFTGPSVDLPTLHATDRSVGASATVRNASHDMSPIDVRLRWVVLSPDGSVHLANGVFQPYTGTEATHDVTVNLGPQDERELRLDEYVTDHPVLGEHVVQLWQRVSCGPEFLAGEARYLAVDDEDDDGLTRAEEELTGTDPTDADTDDDGVGDALELPGDADGDGLLNALDCDSDDDGLPDGLEAGVFSAGADTDKAAGCYRPDLWPATTTAMDVADTDGGGVPDGIEDANFNGRVDPGEGDPNDPADDASICELAPPLEVRGLRLTRDGNATRLAWEPSASDACTTYAVLVSLDGSAFADVAVGLDDAVHADVDGLAGTLRFYLVRADSVAGGAGPTGR